MKPKKVHAFCTLALLPAATSAWAETIAPSASPDFSLPEANNPAVMTASLSPNHRPPSPPPLLQKEPETRFDISPDVHPEQRQPEVSPSENTSDNKSLKISSEQLAQQPELLHRALSSSVILHNVEAVRTLLPIYKKLPAEQRNDEMLITLSDAIIARADGKAGKAVKLYEKALQQEANMPAVRLQLAQSLFEDQQNKEAQTIFAQIKQDSEATEDVRQFADNYLNAIGKRNKINAYAGANYTRDSNINNVPKQRVYRIGNGQIELPQPESAQGIAYRAGADKDWQIKRNYRIRAGAELSGKYYWDNRDYDDMTTRVFAGGAYKSARAETAILPYYERRWFGGSRYSAEKGIRVEHSYWLNPDHQVLIAGEVGKDRYDRRDFLNGKTANFSATWLYVQSPKQYFTLGADLARKQARDRSDAYRRQAIRAAWTREWGKGFQTTVSANAGRREYDAGDFFNIVRRDKEYSATVSIWNKNLSLWGVSPRLVGVYQKNKSNHFMHNYHKAYGFIQLSKSI